MISFHNLCKICLPRIRQLLYVTMFALGIYFIHQGDVLQKYLKQRTAFTVYKEEVSELPTIVTWIGMADHSRHLIFEKDYWILFKLGSLPLVSSDNLTQLKYGANYIRDSYGIIVQNYSRTP